MNLYNFGLKYIEANTPSYKIEDPTIGIVTGTDSNTFTGVQTLFASIKNKVNFICYDIGLTNEQLNWSEKNGMNVVKFDINIKQIDKWQTYLKPFFIKQSPFEYTLWIDSDCIVSGDLTTSDIIMNKTTFFVEHWIQDKFLRKNHPDLYKLYPVKGESTDINAGVFGINKTVNPDIIDEWIFLVNSAIEDEEIRRLTVHWDEGCLLWAIRKTNNGKLILEDYRYNCQTDVVPDPNTTMCYRKPFAEITNEIVPSKFFKQVIDSKVLINHFSTCMENNKKYWTRWTP